MRAACFVLALAAVFGVRAPEAFAITNQQGQACTTHNVAMSANGGAVDDGNNLTCISSVWQYPVYVHQSAAASAQSSCSTYPVGATRWNTTITNLEVCDGTTWQAVGNTSSSCGSPSGLSFTNLTSQSLSTVVTSSTATITFSGCSSGLSVSVTGAATAQISVNGGAWATSGTILSGQTLQVRMTTSGSVSTTLTATVTVASTSTNWTTTTRSGSLNVFMTAGAYVGTGIGGLSGADAICASEANTAGYAGTYKAIMSDNSTSAASRLTLSYPIVNAYDSSTVSGINLWNGTISNPIKTPSGGTSTSAAWTGSNLDGTIATGDTCSNWGAGGSNGQYGYGNYPGVYLSSGLWDSNAAVPCSSHSFGLFCIQQ